MKTITLDKTLIDAALSGRVDAFAHFEQADFDVSRMFVSDMCYAVAVLAGRAIRLVAAAQQRGLELRKLVVPSVCKKCVLEGLEGIIERAVGSCPDIEWVDDWPDIPVQHVEDALAAQTDAPSKPRVGIIGTAPLCFEPFLNDRIAGLIDSLGYELIYPRKEGLFTDDVRYEDELARFAKLGVRKVIYLQSFGCLKGHVQARGSLQALSRKYPDLQITILDYDAEASALNRENRIRLALGFNSDD